MKSKMCLSISLWNCTWFMKYKNCFRALAALTHAVRLWLFNFLSDKFVKSSWLLCSTDIWRKTTHLFTKVKRVVDGSDMFQLRWVIYQSLCLKNECFSKNTVLSIMQAQSNGNISNISDIYKVLRKLFLKHKNTACMSHPVRQFSLVTVSRQNI